MTTLGEWGPADDRALDRWLTRGDRDDDPPEDGDELLPDCEGGAAIGPGAAPCGGCARCLGLPDPMGDAVTQTPPDGAG